MTLRFSNKFFEPGCRFYAGVAARYSVGGVLAFHQ